MKKQAGTYVDGFVIPIPTKNTAQYIKMARQGSRIWKKFGALDYKECVLENMKHNKGEVLTFPKMVKAKPGEAVWFSFIVYKSRAHRDAVNKKVMAYFAKQYDAKEAEMPFDMKRFAYAGFKVVVSA